MTTEILEMTPTGHRRVVGSHPCLATAMEAVQAMGVVLMEVDADHPTCADALTLDGRVLALQPQGFRLP